MHKRKVLFFASSYTKNQPRGIRFQNIIKHIEKVYNVHILAFDYGMLFEKSPENSLHILEHGFISKILNKNIFFPSLAGSIRGKILGLFNFILSKLLFPDDMIIEKQKIINKIIALHEKHNFEFIVTVAFPFTSFAIGKELKEKGLKFKWIVDIGDPFAENSVYQFSNSAKEKAKFYEGSTLSYADAIIVTNSMTRKMYKEKYPKLLEKEISVIPQGADMDIIINNKTYNSVNDTFTLVYAGIFYPKLREPYELFKAIKYWKERCNINIYGMSNIYGFNNKKIHFMGRVSHRKVIDAYHSADVLVFIDNAFGLQASGKIFELLAMKKPILFISDNSASLMKEMVGEHNFVFFTKNNARDIEEALENIKENKNNFVFDFDINSVTWKQRAEAYANLFEKISDDCCH